MTHFIHVRNWDRFQHPDTTRGRATAAPWIKDYTAQQSDDDYRDLTLAERGLLHSIRQAYALRKCSGIPANTAKISSIIGARVSKRQLKRLSHAGFIVFSASKLLADSTQIPPLDVDVDVDVDNQGRNGSSYEGNGPGNELEERRLIREAAARSLKEAQG